MKPPRRAGFNGVKHSASVLAVQFADENEQQGGRYHVFPFPGLKSFLFIGLDLNSYESL